MNKEIYNNLVQLLRTRKEQKCIKFMTENPNIDYNSFISKDAKNTLLMIACKYACFKVIRLLIQKGTNLGAVDANGFTALMILLANDAPVSENDIRITLPRELINTGKSNLNHINVNGMSALYLAIDYINPYIALDILNSSELQLPIMYGKEVLNYALQKNLDSRFDEVISLLKTLSYNNTESVPRININANCYSIEDNETLPLLEFIEKSVNNIVFMIINLDSNGNHIVNNPIIVGINKELFTNLSRSNENQLIVYECIQVNTMRPENINRKIKYFNIKALLGFADLIHHDIFEDVQNSLFDSNSVFRAENINSRFFYLIETNKKLVSTVSYENVHNPRDFRSSRHCQEGQGATIYDIGVPIPYCGEKEEKEEGKKKEYDGFESKEEDIQEETKEEPKLTATVLLNGEKQIFIITPETTMSNIKEMVYNNLEKTPETLRVRLMYKGKILNDTDIVTQVIMPEDVINAFTSKIGGRTRRRRRTNKRRTNKRRT